MSSALSTSPDKRPSSPPSAETNKEAEAYQELESTVNSFRYYYPYVQQRLDRTCAAYAALPPHHRQLLPTFESSIGKQKDVAKKNYEFLLRVLPPPKEKTARPFPVAEPDMDKVKTTLQQIVRDWSAGCAPEREKCYGCIMSALTTKYPVADDRSSVSVLVPGAGLCRLAFDIAKEGFKCQANEFSFSMLLIANFILNRNQGINSHKIYPWVLNFSNNVSTNDQLEEYYIPDVDTSLRDGHLTMLAGDFLEIYSENESWNDIVTCFFLDTARNVIQYIEHIYKLLKPGGSWINIGPLLYHYSDNPGETSLDLSYEQIKQVIIGIGFEMEDEQFPVIVPYVENRRSMLHTSFHCVFFTATKRKNSPSPS